MIDREIRERIIIVGTNAMTQGDMDSYMKELENLVEADGGEVVGELIQRNHVPNAKFYIGPGKVQELKEAVETLEAEGVVMGCELTGIQLRNLEKTLDIKVIDRTHLILDIFALRARTKEAKLQVRLAQLEYGKSRLVGSYALSRTGGGIGTRGPGEQKLEIDRRHIAREIDSIKKKLAQGKVQRHTRRAQRQKRGLKVVSLIGYTNAGKSTLMNALMPEEDLVDRGVFAKDMLFATLDATLRRVSLGKGKEIILSDTVGFVSNLPTFLVEAFHSTLEEIRYSQCIIHVLDGMNEDLMLQYQTTMEVLKELNLMDVPRITVINKMDGISKEDLFLPRISGKVLFISAKKKEGLEELKKAILEELEGKEVVVRFRFSFEEMDKVSRWMNRYPFSEVIYDEKGALFVGKIPQTVAKAFEERWEKEDVPYDL